MPTTTRGFPYPDGGDPPDGPTAIHALATAVDAAPGIATLTYAQINALAGAALWDGRRVYQTDTGTTRPVKGEYTYNGVNWRLPWNMPWGMVAFVQNGSLTQNIGTSMTDVIGVTTGSLALVDNRIYEVRAKAALVVQNTTAGQVRVALTDLSGTGLAMVVDETLGIDGHTTGYISQPLFGLSGTGGWKLRADTTASTMTCSAASGDPGPWHIAVYDVGPDGSPT